MRDEEPDLIGFGRSDKPASMDTHTYKLEAHQPGDDRSRRHPHRPHAGDRHRRSVYRGRLRCATAFGDSDPISRGGERPFQRRVPGAQGQPHVTVEGAGHFIQESHGEDLARIINEFIAANPVE